jgi:hypothetical protein
MLSPADSVMLFTCFLMAIGIESFVSWVMSLLGIEL